MRDWASHVRQRLSTLHLSPTREREIIDEIAQHLEDRWREAISGGASPEDATRQALEEFDDQNTLAACMEPLRQARPPNAITPGASSGNWLHDIQLDLRYAGRRLRQRPTLAAAAVLTLALGVGANAAIFAIVHTVLLKPLPYPGSRELLAVHTRYLPSTGYDFAFSPLSGPEFADIRGRVTAFSGIAAYAFSSRNLTGDAEQPERVLTLAVTAEFFDVIGVVPAQGRPFAAAEAQTGAACVAVLSHEASATAGSGVGSTIRLDDSPCEVIGVMPRGFMFRDDRVRVWTPLAVRTEETLVNRQSHGLMAVARLREHSGAQQIEAQLASLRQYWSEKLPDHYAQGHFAVTRPLQEDLVGDQRTALLLLGGAVLMVLLIACVNVAALLVATTEGRRREFALRQALGAGRLRLMRQLLAEGVLLAIIGGAVGLALSHGILAALLSIYPERLPLSASVSVDSVAVLYTAVVVLGMGLFVGAAPALSASATRMHDTLRGDSRTATASPRAVHARSALVACQLAMSVVLLSGAALLIRSYERLQRIDLGVDANGLLTFSVFVPPARQPEAAGARRTLSEIERRLASTPGVEAAGAISNLPLASAGPPDDFVIDGRPAPPPGAPRWNARFLMVTPAAFRALGIPLRRGRLLESADAAGRPLVGVINETAARLYWPGDDPIGRTIRYFPVETSPSIRIVGVVGDVHSLGPDEPAPPAVFVPFEQAPRPAYEGRMMTFVVRPASGEPAAIVPSVRAGVSAVDRGLPLANVRPMSEVVAAAVGQPRFTTVVISFFAGVAFLLAAIGLYGTLSYGVEQRTREIGVRIALGASRRDILRLVVGRGVVLALLGVGAGVPASLALTRLLAGTLPGISATDPLTYVLVITLLAATALLASYLPARRAIRVDPLVALRAE